MSKSQDSGKLTEIVNHSTAIQIFPSNDEMSLPTFDILAMDQPSRVESWIRSSKSRLTKPGCLVAQATLIPIHHIPPPYATAQTAISTTADIQFLYNSSEAKDFPPTLKHIKSRIRAQTFLSNPCFETVPAECTFDASGTRRTCRTQHFELFSHSVGNIKWEPIDYKASDLYENLKLSSKPRNSGFEVVSEMSSSSLWTAVFSVPIEVPKTIFCPNLPLLHHVSDLYG